MINNDISNQLSRYFSNRGAQNGTGGVASELYKKLKAKHDSIHGRNQSEDAEKTAETEKAATPNRVGKGVLRNNKTKEKEQAESGKSSAQTDTKEKELTPEERRQKELQAILDKLDAEEAAKYPSRSKTKTDASAKTESTVVSPETEKTDGNDGITGFLNDLPLFNEFKTGLMDAFKRLDSASAGSISAQYELNYTSMQYIANAAGGYDYKETTFNVKLDLNYVKAAAGGQTGKEISDIISGSEDFESLINNLNNLNNLNSTGQAGQAQATQPKPEDFLTSLQDYFSPEKTAGRILDFATAFFPMSDAFKAKGDTEEARSEFAEIMRKAIQKGFDQAMGQLGKVPKETQDGIDKTHELVFKGIDDFVKNGLNKNKEQQGVYSALEQFAFSAQISYSEKSYSVSTYERNGTTTNTQPTQSALDTQA